MKIVVFLKENYKFHKIDVFEISAKKRRFWSVRDDFVVRLKFMIVFGSDFGAILDDFGWILEGFWEDFGRILEGFGGINND